MGGPVLDREAADRALQRLADESDRIAQALVAMDGHPGHQLLRGATLTGLTLRRWTEASATMATLWAQFEAYRTLLDRAKDVRARKVKPGQAELDELTELLTGPVVELGAEQVPIDQRSLTGPALQTERISLTELVTRMKDAFTSITEVLAVAEKAWSAAMDRLDPVAEELAEVTALAEGLGAIPAIAVRLSAASETLTETRQLALSDPLTVAATEPLERLSVELADLRSWLEGLATVRDTFPDRLARLQAQLADLEATQEQARQATATVLTKIASPVLPVIEETATAALHVRLAALPAVRESALWPRLAGELDDLDKATRAALSEAGTQLRTITGLLDRRAELRGRLEAYRAKAERLGRAEDLELDALHGQAHALLFTAPCDLAAATRAVNRYQQAVRSGIRWPAAEEGSR